MSTSTSAGKRKAEEEEEVPVTKKQKLANDEEESGSEEEGDEFEEASEEEIDDDELLDLQQDLEEVGGVNTTGRRTRGVKIDFTNKTLPGEKEGAVDDDDDEEEEKTAEKDEPVVEGKGKGRVVDKPTSKAGGSSSKA